MAVSLVGTSDTNSEPVGSAENDVLVAFVFGFVGSGAAPSIGSGSWTHRGTAIYERFDGNNIICAVYTIKRGASAPNMTLTYGSWGSFGPVVVIRTYRGIDHDNFIGFTNDSAEESPLSLNPAGLTVPDSGVAIIAAANWSGNSWLTPSGFGNFASQGWGEVGTWDRLNTAGLVAPTITNEVPDYGVAALLVFGPPTSGGDDDVEIDLEGVEISLAGVSGNLTPVVTKDATSVTTDIAAAVGVPLPSVRLELQGASEALEGLSAGVSPSVAGELSGQATDMTMGAGDISPSVSASSAGHETNLNVSHGTVKAQVAQVLTGAEANLSVAGGTLIPLISIESNGVSISLSVEHGILNVEGSEEVQIALSGSEIGIVTTNGSVTPLISLNALGEAISIASSLGQIIPSINIDINGYHANISNEAGQLKPEVSANVLGQLATILGEIGVLTPDDAVVITLSGSQIEIESFIGSLTPVVEVSMIGESTSIAVINGVLFAFNGSPTSDTIMKLDGKITLSKAVTLWKWNKP